MIKYLHSGMPGAPVLSGTAGAMLGVLDACLVNGFGLKTADSLVVAGGVAALTISTGHSFEPDTIALIAGATPSGLNGEKRVLTITTNAITFDATGISNQTATGTITARLAPLGFAKSFSGTNLAAYRSADVTGSRMFLRVDDTGTLNARVVGYESMSDVSTGVAPFPTSAQMSGGRWWPKSSAASSAARPWVLIGDGKTFYIAVYTGTLTSKYGGIISAFGDFVPERSGDPYACLLSGADSDITASGNLTSFCVGYSAASGSLSINLPRSFSFLGGSSAGYVRAESFFTASGVSGGSADSGLGTTFPSPVNNGLYLSGVMVCEGSNTLRGRARGYTMTPQPVAAAFDSLAKLDGQGLLIGKKLLAVKCGSPLAAQSGAGTVFFDLTGPWS